MIGILLNDNAYEQDIRELLMAFYSGETFAHQKGAEVSFYVEGTVNETRDQFTIRFLDKDGQPIQNEEEKNQPWAGFPEELSGEWRSSAAAFPSPSLIRIGRCQRAKSSAACTLCSIPAQESCCHGAH